jgi:hypothetical protein
MIPRSVKHSSPRFWVDVAHIKNFAQQKRSGFATIIGSHRAAHWAAILWVDRLEEEALVWV